MKNNANAVKKRLLSLIRNVLASRHLYIYNPEKDFTRKRKLTFEIVMQTIISMGGNSIYKELLEINGFDAHTATSSAFVQQPNKLKSTAFEFLLHSFTNTYTIANDFKKCESCYAL